MVVEALAAALICLDPGHGTAPDLAGRREPIGPRARTSKVADGGGAPGEAALALALARRTRALLLARGYQVAMTRTSAGFRGGNVERARFCNRRGASLMVRIHADGSTDTALHGVLTLYPAFRAGWTDDVHAASRRAARLLQRAVVKRTEARDLGVRPRGDLTGFNWADVPVVLVEVGFLSNPRERARLATRGYRERIARGLAAGVAAFAPPQ